MSANSLGVAGSFYRAMAGFYRRVCPASVRDRLRIRERLGGLRREAWKYRLPWGPYRRMSPADRRHFAPVLDVWKPADGKPLVFVSWLITEWCNYDCPYCPQTHGRFAPKDGGRYTAHAFDNHTRDEWLAAFRRHFGDRRLSLKITGGESMIDKKNMVPFLDELAKLPALEALRIDTNASWDPTAYRHVDKSRILLMCTFHPSQVSEEVFFQRIGRLLDNGFKVGMINYVMNRDNFNQYVAIRRRAEARGIPVQPNPLWDSRGYYSGAEIDLLRGELPDADFRYRSQTDVPEGRKCLYPAVAYYMNPDGDVAVECHPRFRGRFFDAELPRLFAGPVPCPARGCVCLDMYSFLGEVNRNVAPSPLAVYSGMLLKRPIPSEDPTLPLQPPPIDGQLIDIDLNTFPAGR